MRGDSDRLGKLRARGLSLRSDTPHRLLEAVAVAPDDDGPDVGVVVVVLRSFRRPRAAAFAAAMVVEVSGWRKAPEEDDVTGLEGGAPPAPEGRGDSPSSSPKRGF